MIVKLRDLGGGASLLQCPPPLTKTMQQSTALWDPDQRGWLVQTSEVERITTWLEQLGHVVVSPADMGATLQPPAWSPDAPRQPDEVAQRGAELCRQELAKAAAARRPAGEPTVMGLQTLAYALCKARPDWDFAEVRKVLTQLARTRPISQRALSERTLELARSADTKTPWGLLAAGRSTPPTDQLAGPRASTEDDPDLAPDAVRQTAEIDEAW